MSVFISSKIISKISYEEQSLYYDTTEMANKLFCTFSQKSQLEYRLSEITSQYTIMYGKIFVLVSPESEEYLCTYNVDLENRSVPIISNTILVHRKKESNTLYTVNALNHIIKKMNGGQLDVNYKINWEEYKNSVLLCPSGDFKMLNTFIHTVVKV